MGCFCVLIWFQLVSNCHWLRDLSHLAQGGVNLTLLFGSLKFSHQGCPPRRRSLYYTATRYISIEIYFLMASNPDRITPDRRLPEATQSTLHHYFITSHTETNAYLLIIDKFTVIRYQATVKQSALIFDDAS